MSLFEACQQADVEQVKLLIQQNCNIQQLNEQGRTALHFCCEHQTIDCASLLLEDESIKRAIINIQDSEGFSVLHLACLNGNLTMVKYFCEQGADVTLLDNESHSVIHWITVCGYISLFDILIQYKAPIHTADAYGAFPIHYASQLSSNNDPVTNVAILKKLIDNHADVDCLDEQKRTPFIWAASANATEALRTLYKVGANPLHADKNSLTGTTYVDDYNNTLGHFTYCCLALHCAATCGHASCIRVLVELYECPLESEDINGCTALFYAITFEHKSACRILLDLKANPNHKDNRGRTPSHCAALKGNIDCLKLLLKSNADIWIQNKRGDYPVHEAINAVSLCKARNPTEDTSQLQVQCCDLVRFIFHLYPKKINIRNGEHRTPLHLAASLGDITMCQVLIECGAQINAFIQTTGGNFLTPYDLARIRHHDACADYLVSNHGGQRGNLLVHIHARRIQKYFRQYKISKSSQEDQSQINPTKTSRKKKHRISIHINTSSHTKTKSISSDNLLNQAVICLENKIAEDRIKESKTHSSKPNKYLIDSSEEEKRAATQRRRLRYAESRKTMASVYGSDENEANRENRIIVHASNSITTSTKLYERHKLISEELFKLKSARIRNQCIVISRQLYKILIENAFNPQDRTADEIESYLAKLLQAYETELEAIRKRTQSVPSRRVHDCSQRTEKAKKNLNHD